MWVVSTSVSATSTPTDFRPLAGCGLFLSDPVLRGCSLPRFRPLAGCGLFLFDYGFPRLPLGFRPLAGCGLFPHDCRAVRSVSCFRPLAGCGLFLLYVDYRAGAAKFPSPCGVWVVSTICVKIDGRYIVSVPLRGVGCFFDEDVCAIFDAVSVPLRGVGCFLVSYLNGENAEVSVPLRGVGCFVSAGWNIARSRRFPSPCGVWVVSAKLHILSGATGKRIVNSAILLYHIGRCLSIAN